MTKKDYLKIADVLKNTMTFAGCSQVIQKDLIQNLCRTFKDDNPKFNKQKFWDYILKD